MAVLFGVREGLVTKTVSRARHQLRGRRKINGTTKRPHAVITRFARHLYVQVIDDTVGRTLVSASTMETDLRATEGDRFVKARRVGEIIAQRAKEAGIRNTVFNRAGNKHHGRITAPADAARRTGLGF